MGIGMIYGMATLKIPHVQSPFERLGWQIIGITPGFDREMVAPGVVKRVFEVVYDALHPPFVVPEICRDPGTQDCGKSMSDRSGIGESSCVRYPTGPGFAQRCARWIPTLP